MNELIANLAEKLGVTPKALIITVIFFVAAFAVLWIKMTLDEKKGVDSKEKEEIRKIIGNLVPDGVQYTAAYAHSTEYQGRIRYYHYYAVGFRADQPDHIWVIPIGVEGDRIVYTEPVRASAENLEYVGGNSSLLLLKFPGKRNNCIQLSVSSSNTKLGKECRVNIQQPEESKAFDSFAEAFQEKVNAALGVDKKGRALRN